MVAHKAQSGHAASSQATSAVESKEQAQEFALPQDEYAGALIEELSFLSKQFKQENEAVNNDLQLRVKELRRPVVNKVVEGVKAGRSASDCVFEYMDLTLGEVMSYIKMRDNVQQRFASKIKLACTKVFQSSLDSVVDETRSHVGFLLENHTDQLGTTRSAGKVELGNAILVLNTSHAKEIKSIQDSHKDEVASLNERFAADIAEVKHELTKSRSLLDAEKAAAKRNDMKHRGTIESLKMQLDAIRRSSAAVQATRDTLQEEREKLANQVNTLQNAADSQRRMYEQKLNDQQSELQFEVERAKNLAKESAEKAQKYQKEFEDLQSLTISAKQQIEEAHDLAAKYKTKCETATSENAKLSGELSKLAREHKKLVDTKERIQKERDEVRVQVSQLLSDNNTLTEQNAELTKAKEVAERDLAEVSNGLQKQRKLVTELNIKNSELLQSIDKQQKQVEGLEKALEVMEEKEATMKQENERLSASTKSLKSEVSALNEQLELAKLRETKLQNEFNRQTERYNSLKEEFATCQETILNYEERLQFSEGLVRAAGSSGLDGAESYLKKPAGAEDDQETTCLPESNSNEVNGEPGSDQIRLKTSSEDSSSDEDRASSKPMESSANQLQSPNHIENAAVSSASQISVKSPSTEVASMQTDKIDCTNQAIQTASIMDFDTPDTVGGEVIDAEEFDTKVSLISSQSEMTEQLDALRNSLQARKVDKAIVTAFCNAFTEACEHFNVGLESLKGQVRHEYIEFKKLAAREMKWRIAAYDKERSEESSMWKEAVEKAQSEYMRRLTMAADENSTIRRQMEQLDSELKKARNSDVTLIREMESKLRDAGSQIESYAGVISAQKRQLEAFVKALGTLAPDSVPKSVMHRMRVGSANSQTSKAKSPAPKSKLGASTPPAMSSRPTSPAVLPALGK